MLLPCFFAFPTPHVHHHLLSTANVSLHSNDIRALSAAATSTVTGLKNPSDDGPPVVIEGRTEDTLCLCFLVKIAVGLLAGAAGISCLATPSDGMGRPFASSGRVEGALESEVACRECSAGVVHVTFEGSSLMDGVSFCRGAITMGKRGLHPLEQHQMYRYGQRSDPGQLADMRKNV